MKAFFLAVSATLITCVACLSSQVDDSFLDNSDAEGQVNNVVDPFGHVYTFRDLISIRAELEGFIATGPDLPIPPRLPETVEDLAYPSWFSQKDNCLIDCDGDWKRAWGCYYYNNTRCWSCRLSSHDQSCMADCQCLKADSPPIGTHGNPNEDNLSTRGYRNDKRRLAVKEGVSGSYKDITVRSPKHWAVACNVSSVASECVHKGATCNENGKLISGDAGCENDCGCSQTSQAAVALTNVIRADVAKRDTIGELAHDATHHLDCGNQRYTLECAQEGLTCGLHGEKEGSASEKCQYLCVCKSNV